MDGHDRPPVSVILPTHKWGSVCTQLAHQLDSEDELLVVCDTDADPVTSRTVPDNVRILVAGEPEKCSGKANAVAYGMEHARNDRFVWTDDDFDREDDWLDRLITHGEEQGPATVIPFFVGGRWWSLLEPWTVFFASFSFYTGIGLWGGNAWGGGATFTREDVNVDQLIADLRCSLSDDGVLSEHLTYVSPIRSMYAYVEVPGDFHAVKERMIRFNRLTHVHEGILDALAILLILVLVALVSPIAAAGIMTVGMAGIYALLRFPRWTFLLTFPGLFLAVLPPIAGILTNEFEWAGRRYRLNDAYDVDVLTERDE